MMKLTHFKVVPLWTFYDRLVTTRPSLQTVNGKVLATKYRSGRNIPIIYNIIKEQNFKPADTDQSTIKIKTNKNHVSYRKTCLCQTNVVAALTAGFSNIQYSIQSHPLIYRHIWQHIEAFP